MSENSKIEWTDHTFNPWIGCASLADWLDDEVATEWRVNLLELVHATPSLDWQLLTKRPHNWQRLTSEAFDFAMKHGDDHGRQMDFTDWIGAWTHAHLAPANVWLGTTVEDQPRAEERIPELLKIPAQVRFLSCEPLLGEVDLGGFLPWKSEHQSKALPEPLGGALRGLSDVPGVDWVICGGESGPGARPMHPEWARSLRDQCQAAGVPFFFKQWGEWAPVTAYCAAGCGEHPSLRGYMSDDYSVHYLRDDQVFTPITGIAGKIGKKAAGRLLDGLEWSEFPTPWAFRARSSRS